MNHNQIIEIFAKYTGHIIAIVCLFQIYLIYYTKRREFFTGLKGKDLTWQLLEISGIGWYMLFPMLVVADILGLHASSIVWGSMDFIYVANLGMKRLDKYIELKESKPNTQKNEQETH